MWWALVAIAWAEPTADELASSWASHQQAFEAHAVYPFAWSEEEWRTVSRGRVVKRRERLEGADRVVGMIYIPADLDETWLAIQDDHGQYVDGMVNEELAGTTHQRRLWYQSLDLPWPFETRQWMIAVVNNDPLRQATAGNVWERTWQLLPDQESRAAKNRLDDAIWLPVNDGGWYLAAAPEGTLVIYHARTVMSGSLPDNAAQTWAYLTLGNMLKKLRERATEWVPDHYVGSHAPILRPDGTKVPTR